MKTTKHRNGRRWTTEQLKSLMEMWAAGRPVEEIAAELEATTHAILKMVQRLRGDGIPLARRTRGHKHGRANKPWTQEEIEYLYRRRLAGATDEEIAIDLGRSWSAVQNMASVLRQGGAPIAMRGQGVRRLWSVEALKGAAMGRFDAEEVALAEDLPPN
jgi:biotin operon repressor